MIVGKENRIASIERGQCPDCFGGGLNSSESNQFESIYICDICKTIHKLIKPIHSGAIKFDHSRAIFDAINGDRLSKAMKFDDDKCRMDLIPPEALEALGDVLGFGAKKYADRNWEKGLDWSRPYGAALRHLVAWQKGEDTDPESGLPHLEHALCCVTFLVTYARRGVGKDDRPKIQGDREEPLEP